VRRFFVIQIGKYLRQNLFEFVRLDNRLQPRPVLVVLRHGHVKEICRPFGVKKLVKIGRGQSVGHLSGAVSAEIIKNDRVIIANQADWLCGGTVLVHNDNWLHEFIGDVRFVAGVQRGDWISGSRLSFAVHHRAVGKFDAFPAIVAIHRVVAPDQRRDFANTELAHFLLQLLHEIAPTVWRSVAAIDKAVHKNILHFVLLGHFQQSKKMLDV